MRSGTPHDYECETGRLISSPPLPYFCSSPLNDWQLPLESRVLSFMQGCEISGRRIQGYERRTKLPEIGQEGGLAEGSWYLWVLRVLAGSDHCCFWSTSRSHWRDRICRRVCHGLEDAWREKLDRGQHQASEISHLDGIWHNTVFPPSLFKIFTHFMCMVFCLRMYVYMYVPHVSSTWVGQKKVLGPLELKFSLPPCGCWELNTGPLEEQPVLLTTEPCLWLQAHF